MTPSPASIQARQKRLFSKIGELGIDAVIILGMQNIRYFTGFTGSEGALIAAGGKVCLLVDGRYINQAPLEATVTEIVQFKDKLESVAGLVRDWGVGSAAMEAAYVSCQQFSEISEKIPGFRIKMLGDEMTRLRCIKDTEEIEFIRLASALSGRAVDNVMDLIKPGITEADIALELDYRMRKSGSEGVSFDTIVASGENSALPHAHPSARRLRKGDFVIIDYGGVLAGYHSDETCTFGVGEISTEQAKVYEIVKKAHDSAVSVIKPGVHCKFVDGTARSIIEEEGFGPYFLHGTGHGVGLEVHEYPRVSPQGDALLEPGMVITVEPGIYLSGSFGVRIESLIAVTDDGFRVLSTIDKGLKLLG